MQLRNQKIHLVSLQFFDQGLELQFLDYFYQKTIHQTRVALLVGVFLYSIFGILDSYIIPDFKQGAWIIRYGLVAPLLAATWLFSFSRQFKRFRQSVHIILTLIAGAGILAMLLAASPPGNYLYYTGLILVIMYTYMFVKLRFLPACIVSWTILFSYEAATLLIKPLPLPFFLNNSFFLLGANLIGMISCYESELTLRRDFLRRKQLYELEQTRHLMEKEKILRDLHDGVGGMSTSIAMLADMAQKESSLAEIKKTLTNISDLATESVSEIRSFLRSLDVKDLTWQTLAGELRYRGSSMMAPHGIDFTLHDSVEDSLEPPCSLVSLVLCKIYREALTNVLKHAYAKKVSVDLVARRDQVRVSIHDDGIGYSQDRNGGRGLEIMRARVREIGGALKITKNGGTTVEITILPEKYLLPGME